MKTTSSGDMHVTGLPPIQAAVLEMRAEGCTYRECARRLNCSTANIKQAVSTLFFKLHADTTQELIINAIRKGYLELRSIFIAGLMCLLSVIQVNDGINARVSRTTRTQSIRAARGGKQRSLLIDIEDIC